MNDLAVFIIGMLAGGVLQAFTEGILEALNSNKPYRCEGPGCGEFATPERNVRYRLGAGKWHHFHDGDCASAWMKEHQ